MNALKTPRKSLSTQLDRLDSILDGLAEAIPQTVALAVADAVRSTLHEILAELLSKPELLTALIPPTAQPVACEPVSAGPAVEVQRPRRFAFLRGWGQTLARTLTSWLQKGREVVHGLVGKAGRAVSFGVETGRRLLGVVWDSRKPILRAGGVALGVAVVGWTLGPVASAALTFLSLTLPSR